MISSPTGPALIPGLLLSATSTLAIAASGGGSGGGTPPPTPTITLSASITRAEGNSGANLYVYTVSRSTTAGAVTVAWSFSAGGTNAADYTGGVLPTGGTVTIADGAGSATISISVNGDSDVEGDESFGVSIAVPGGYAAGGSLSASGTIANDDSGATYLGMDDVFLLAGNSYEAQVQANDNAGWARNFSGIVGYAPIHWRHARGGDTLANLIGDRAAESPPVVDASGRLVQILKMNPKGIFLMSPQNSMGVEIELLKNQYRAIISYAIARGVTKFVVPTQLRTAALTASAVLPINTFIRSTLPAEYPGIISVADRDAVLDLTANGFDSGTHDHTNARGSIILGQCDGAAIRACFAGPRVTNYTVEQTGNFHTGWNMPDANADGLSDGWGLNNGYAAAGITVATTMGTFRSPGMTSVPCQILTVTGTSTADPAGVALELFKTIAVPAATQQIGRSWRMMPFVEISNAGAASWAAATGPVNMASFYIGAGSNGLFGTKAYGASNGAIIFPDKFAGLIATAPAAQTAVVPAGVSVSVQARPMLGVAASYEIRFGYVQLLLDGATAIGEPYDQSIALPTGRQPIFTPPTITGTTTVGSVLSYGKLGNISGEGFVEPTINYGGGIAYPLNCFVARSPYGLPGDVAGNVEPARPGSSVASAVTYTVQAGDVGQKLKMGVQAKNSFGELIVYSVETATVT